jgi:type II secretory pathway pseudopilin PulG
MEGAKMKRTIVSVVLLAIVSVLIAGTAVTAADGPTLSQFRQLKRQVNRIENQVELLQDQVAQLKAAPTNACLGTINVAQFDDYEQYPDAGSITALDIDNVNPDWRVVTRIC